MKTEKQEGRILFLAISSIIFVLYYILYLFGLQVINTNHYSSIASTMSSREQVIYAHRGEIFDRHMRPIALNKTVFSVFYKPDKSFFKFDEAQRTAHIKLITDVLALEPHVVQSIIKRLDNKNLRTLLLTNNVTYTVIVRLAEQSDTYSFLSWKQANMRYYPYGAVFSQVLGYTGKISSDELRLLYNQGYQLNDMIGKLGIERQYDHLLRGKNGRLQQNVDVREVEIDKKNLILEPAVNGYQLILNLDLNMQILARKALGKRIGSVLIMKPSGEILAMVSYPDFDPNVFYQSANEAVVKKILSSSDSLLLNRNIQAAGPPASVFKVVDSVAALSENIISSSKKIFDPGYLRVGKRKFKNHRLSGHGWTDLHRALVVSNNTYFYTVGLLLGNSTLYEYAKRFGLGELTGIDLPHEIKGLLPSAEWKKQVYQEQWYDGDTANMAIGQGYMLVTPLQVGNMMASIMNNGIRYEPRVLKGFMSDNTVQEYITAQQLSEEQFNANIMRIVRSGLYGVVNNAEGSVYSVITTDEISIAGKTGTGQTGISEENKHSWFVSYAPYFSSDTRERLIVVVWIDGRNQWDWWAPKASEIIYNAIYGGRTYEAQILDLHMPWWLPKTEHERAQKRITEDAQLLEKVQYFLPSEQGEK